MAKKILQFVGYGIIIWLITFFIGSIIIFLKVKEISTDLFDVIITISAALAAFLLARTIPVEDNKSMLKYSSVWVLVSVILDILVTMRFNNTGWAFFKNWYIWFGYGLILLVPSLIIPAIPPEEKI